MGSSSSCKQYFHHSATPRATAFLIIENKGLRTHHAFIHLVSQTSMLTLCLSSHSQHGSRRSEEIVKNLEFCL